MVDDDPIGFSDGLLESGFGSCRAAALLTWTATIRRMLSVEVALARVQAQVGVIDAAEAERIAQACDPERLDLTALARAARDAPTPVIPLLAAVRAAAPEVTELHRGATSQDVIDTARLCQVADTLDLLLEPLVAALGATARLADAHRHTVVAGRTLGRHAVPTSAGAVMAGWHAALAHQVVVVRRGRRELPAVQFGGVVGTLSGHGRGAFDVHDALAAELGLAAPAGPWHVQRGRITGLVGLLLGVLETLDVVAGELIRRGGDDIGEFVTDPGRGPGSSALPHKRNPVDAVAARAAVRLGVGHLHALLPPRDLEFERAAGAWQAEWVALPAALVATVGAAERVASAVASLTVDADRARRNLSASAGLLAVESLTLSLADAIGPAAAREVVAGIVADRGARDLATAAATQPTVVAALGPDGLAAALDPRSSLTHVDELIDRALEQGRRASIGDVDGG